MPQAEDQLALLLIPAPWTELLQRIREVCPSAVLAGGALRDLDNGREVKDLDLFITCVKATDAEAAIEALEVSGFEIMANDDFESGKVYPEDRNPEVIQIADLLGFDLPVQLIFTNWPTGRIVDRFDYGICRLSWDGAALVRPPEYDEDKRDQVFRLRRDRPTPVSMRGSIRRYARLVNGKYSGWDWWPFWAVFPVPSVGSVALSSPNVEMLGRWAGPDLTSPTRAALAFDTGGANSNAFDDAPSLWYNEAGRGLALLAYSFAAPVTVEEVYWQAEADGTWARTRSPVAGFVGRSVNGRDWARAWDFVTKEPWVANKRQFLRYGAAGPPPSPPRVPRRRPLMTTSSSIPAGTPAPPGS